MRTSTLTSKYADNSYLMSVVALSLGLSFARRGLTVAYQDCALLFRFIGDTDEINKYKNAAHLSLINNNFSVGHSKQLHNFKVDCRLIPTFSDVEKLFF